MLFSAVKFALLFRLCMSGQGFLYGLRLPVSPFPWQIADLHVIGPTVLPFLSTHSTLFVDPGRSSESSPICSLCVGFRYRYTIAICFILSNEAVSRLQVVRLPYGLCGSLCTLQSFCSVLNIFHNCNTRYGWLVRPYPTGTYTLQETPSFLAHNGDELIRPGQDCSSSLDPADYTTSTPNSPRIPGPIQRVDSQPVIILEIAPLGDFLYRFARRRSESSG
jgi:hypothetical protein